MHPNRNQRSFLLQALVFLVPVLFLGAVGFASLREDRALVEKEASERAAELARILGDKLFQKLALGSNPWLTTNLIRDVSIPLERANLAEPVKDPIWVATQSLLPLDGCFLAADLSLLYPPPKIGLLDLSPLRLESLESNQRIAWLAARELEYGPDREREALQAYRSFLEFEPPLPFECAARYACGLLLRRLGQTEDALVEFAKLTELPPARSEGGIPYSQLAALQLPLQPKAALQLRTQAIWNPSPLSTKLLEKADTLVPAPLYADLWRSHERARALFAGCPSGSEDFSLNTFSWWGAQSNWLAHIVPLQKPQGWSVTARTSLELEASAREVVMSVMGSSPYFGCNVSLFAKPLHPTSKSRVMALHSSPPGISIEIVLSRPDLLYAQTSRRFRLFSFLIVIALLTAVFGFVSNWLAFRKQVLLNEMKTNFVSSVSHELRAPLASIRLMADGLQAGTTRPEKQAQYFAFITQECQRLARLVENVLDVSRIEQNRKEYDFAPVDLPALVDKTVETMKPGAHEKGVRLELQTKPSPEFDRLLLDPGAIQQALINLIDNAIKHSPRSSVVLVTLAARDGMVALSVIDHGEGIPKSEHEKIFKRFYRVGPELRRTTQGAGIGLSIVKHVAEAHGARIRLRSVPGEGSEFAILFFLPKK